MFGARDGITAFVGARIAILFHAQKCTPAQMLPEFCPIGRNTTQSNVTKCTIGKMQAPVNTTGKVGWMDGTPVLGSSALAVPRKRRKLAEPHAVSLFLTSARGQNFSSDSNPR